MKRERKRDRERLKNCEKGSKCHLKDKGRYLVKKRYTNTNRLKKKKPQEVVEKKKKKKKRTTNQTEKYSHTHKKKKKKEGVDHPICQYNQRWMTIKAIEFLTSDKINGSDGGKL